MAFADDFRDTAVPALREAAKAQALFVALDLIDIKEARDTLAAQARKAGSGLLRAPEQDRLAEWIANVVWREVEAASDRVVAIEQRAKLAAMVDPARYYDGLADRCSNPDRMRWVFAAICPPYRKHLLEKRRDGR